MPRRLLPAQGGSSLGNFYLSVHLDFIANFSHARRNNFLILKLETMNENKFFEQPNQNPELESKQEQKEQEAERELNPEEIEQLDGEMKEYTEGLKALLVDKRAELEGATAEQIEALQAEIADIEEQLAGLEDFSGAIESGDFEKITESSEKK